MELKYFNGAGRGETIRIMLHASGADWTDTRFTGKDWPSIKPTTPLGSVPVLNVDGRDFCQSIALNRYAAKLAGFYPEDPLKALVVDECMDTLSEVGYKIPYGGSDDELKEKRQAFQKDDMPKFFDLVESRITTMGGGNTVCGEPSVADVLLMIVVRMFTTGSFDYLGGADYFKDYPGITSCTQQIATNEKVKSYYDSVDQKRNE